MLVGYVSDERYVALDDVGVEFERDGDTVAVVRSTPRGKVIADLAPGRYRVTLRGSGLRTKVGRHRPRRGRRAAPVPAALGPADGLRLAALGQRRRAGRAVLPRHGIVPADARCATARGASSCASSAGTTSTARTPTCRSRPTATGRRPASGSTASASPATPITPRRSRLPSGRGCTTWSRRASPGRGSRPRGWWRRARERRPRRSPSSSRRTPGTRTTTSAAVRTTSTPPGCRHEPTVNGRQELSRYRDERAARLDRPRRGVPAAVVRAPRAVQRHPRGRRAGGPDRGPPGQPSRAGRVAPAGVAGGRRLRLRRVLRRAARRRHARPRTPSRADDPRAPGVLDAAAVRADQDVGGGAGRPADVSRRQRPQLRGRAARRRARSCKTKSHLAALDGRLGQADPADPGRTGSTPGSTAARHVRGRSARAWPRPRPGS